MFYFFIIIIFFVKVKYETSADQKLYGTSELGSFVSSRIAWHFFKGLESLTEFLHIPRGVGFGAETGSSQMQNYMYEKAMAQETRNGGTSTLNNNNGVDNCKKKLLIALDIICLLLGKVINKFRLNIPLCYYLKC